MHKILIAAAEYRSTT